MAALLFAPFAAKMKHDDEILTRYAGSFDDMTRIAKLIYCNSAGTLADFTRRFIFQQNARGSREGARSARYKRISLIDTSSMLRGWGAMLLRRLDGRRAMLHF